MKKTIVAVLTASSLSLILAACGGSDDAPAVPSPAPASSTPAPAASSPAPAASTPAPAASTPAPTTPTTPVTPTTTITGSAVKGPVSGGTVTVKNAATGAVLGTATTGAAGTYSLAVPFTGDVIVEVTGGNYTDEATNRLTALAAPLKVVLNANGGNVTGIVTPLTTMAFSNAFPTAASAITSAAFNSTATNLANQFKLNGVNLATTIPVVSGTTNDYGKVLAGLSKYMQFENVTLPTLVNTAFTSAQWTTFSGTFSNAYRAANPGSNVTFAFDGSAFTIGGTGAGGGSGTCGVNVTGSIAAGFITVPINLSYCVTGIAAGSCSAGNSSLSQVLSAQSGVAGAANLNYTYTAACAAGAFQIRIQ